VVAVRVSACPADDDLDRWRKSAPNFHNFLDTGGVEPGMDSGKGDHPRSELVGRSGDFRCGKVGAEESNAPTFVCGDHAGEEGSEFVPLARGRSRERERSCCVLLVRG